MPALVHTTFRVSNAKQFKESFEEKSEHGVGGYIPLDMMNTPDSQKPEEVDFKMNTLTNADLDKINKIKYFALNDQMYLFIGRVSAWNEFDTPDGKPDPNINENAPPYPVDSMKDAHFNHWDDMIAAKKVSAGEVSHVIKRERADEIKEGIRNWTRSKRYDTYDDRMDNLFDDDILIHTVNERFRVYKCIKQGIGVWQKIFGDDYDSAVQGVDNDNWDTVNQAFWVWTHQSRREPKATNPLDPGITEDFMTVGDVFNDGYQWKYYYTIDAGEALKFVTTSYIPVRTVRKENGDRENDYSDQYLVEMNAIPGGILNVNVGKVPVEGSDGTVFGYEFTGGGAGYCQLSANTSGADQTTGSFISGSNLIEFKATNFVNNVSGGDCSWPDPQYGNRFDFANAGFLKEVYDAGANADLNALFAGYGVVVKGFGAASGLSDAEKKIIQRYVFPIVNVTKTPGGQVTFAIDTNWVSGRKDAARMIPMQATLAHPEGEPIPVDGLDACANWDAAGAAGVEMFFEVHPKVHVKANHQASSVCDLTNSFEAYAICEPIFDKANSTLTNTWFSTQLGRVVDVCVTNPGLHHYRIDTWDLDGDKYAAKVGDIATLSAHTWDAAVTSDALPLSKAMKNAETFPSIPPVGGHGADPTNELGGFNVMINARFEGTEADEFTVGNEFRKIGILKNPLAYANTVAGYDDLDVRNEMNSLQIGKMEYDKLFRGYKTDQCYRINLEDDSFLTDDPDGNTIFFEPDMEIGFFANSVSGTVWPSVSLANKNWIDGATFGVDVMTDAMMETSCIATAKLVDHDQVNKRIRVIKPRGDFYTVLEGTPPGSDIKLEVRSLVPHKVEEYNVYAISLQTANTAEEPGMLPGSGKILYVENRSMVSRSSNQTEDLKISIQF